MPLCLFGTREIVKLEFQETPMIKWVMGFLVAIWLLAVVAYNI